MRCLWTPVSVLSRSDKVVFTVLVVLRKLCRHVSEPVRNVLKFTFDNGSGCAMFVDSCFIAGKIRQSCFHSSGGPVDLVQACFGTRNVLNFSFDKCRGCAMLVNFCFSAGKIR